MRRFNPEKELKKLQYGNRNKVIFDIMALLLIISIGSTYALYQVRYSKRIIYTKVAPFSNRDIILTVLVDGKKQNDFPNKDGGYYFDGLDCETKGITTATWNYNLWTLNLTSLKPNKCDVLFSKEPSLLTEKIKFLNEHKEGNLETLAADDSDKNIRYIGATPNNYIWFNCDNYDLVTDNESAASEQCEKWRIIGLMNGITIVNGDENTNNPTKQNLIKIVRDESIGNFKYSTTGTNNWENASLRQSLRSYYEGNPINNKKGITSTTQTMVTKVVWNLGGWTGSGTTSLELYNHERGTAIPSGAPLIWKDEIALMYPSDYGFAAGSSCYSTNLNEYAYTCYKNDWLFNGENYWLLSPTSSDSGRASYVASVGTIGYITGSEITNEYAARPTLYLKSNVKIVNGDGSSETPYILTTY